MDTEPNRETFRTQLARSAVVPVTRRLLADALTPVLVWSTLGERAGSYLLESVEQGEKWGRFSFVGLKPARWVRGGQGRFQELEGSSLNVLEERSTDDPWAELATYLGRFAPVEERPDLPRFWGAGLVGYVAYDAVRGFEPKVSSAPYDGWLFEFAVGGTVLVFDNLRQITTLVRICFREEDEDPDRIYANAVHDLDTMTEELSRPRTPRMLWPNPNRVALELPPSNFSQPQFEAAVRRAQDYIRAGDIFQVVLSQRFALDADRVSPFEIYRMLRSINPSPYMYFLRLPEGAVAGASPETLVRVENGVVEVRPLAGTRPRGEAPAQDVEIARELLADPKERAEHVMLVDLGRNDLGRVSRAGTVKLIQRLEVEHFSHVMHIVSTVRGELRDNVGPLDVLQATFPAGTLSGAPKVRAMQIIEELEPVARGVYGGAVGYVGFDGNLDLAIAIRTVVAHGGRLRIQAGAGIVEASDPSTEWRETIAKAKAALAAIAAAREL